jgi:xylose isomerase
MHATAQQQQAKRVRLHNGFVRVLTFMPAGDAQTGWDTDQFLSDPREATLLMGVLIKNGGLGTGGINFDAKIR